MKQISVIILFVLCFGANKVQAQIDSSIHGELRRLHQGLSTANCPAPFFYDFAAHVTNENFYKILCDDTSTTMNWFNLYFEMTYSSYTPGFLPDDTTLYRKVREYTTEHLDSASNVYTPPKIPIGVMDFDFNRLKIDAFDSVNFGRWFYWDDDTIWDNTSRTTSPYETNPETPSMGTCNEIFAASPLVGSSYFKDVTFVIDPANFIFYQNNTYSINTFGHPTPHQFEIDFDDGGGWRVVDPYTYSEIEIEYDSCGVYYPKFRVTNDAQVIKFSISTFIVLNDAESPPPYERVTLPHMEVGIYRGCNHTGPLRPVIYVEGIDVMEVRGVSRIYYEMIADLNTGALPNLINYNYDFVVVNWKSSKADMTINADALAHLIDYLKTRSDTTHQFIVIGESMGGVVARYALTYMETQAYRDRGSSIDSIKYKKWQGHNTRLFISLDAPHQGAVIPLAFQHMTDWAYTVPHPVLRVSAFFYQAYDKAKDIDKNFLKSDAVRQLLKIHRDTRTVGGEYTQHQKRTDFMDDLINLNSATGGWPEHCKLMAITNGLIDGSGQVGFRDRIIQPSDTIADIDLYLGVRIFRVIPVAVFAVEDALFRISPNGNGDVINMGYRFNLFMSSPGWSFKTCLLNLLKRKSSPCNILGVGLPFVVNVTDVEPWETFPGGTEDGAQRLFDEGFETFGNHKNTKEFYSIFINFDPFLGTINIKNWFGAQNILTANFDFKMTSNVSKFCFIPLQSALDYHGFDGLGADLPQDFDIIGNGVGANMLNTPFHIIMGWNTLTTGTNSYPSIAFEQTAGGEISHNGEHLFIRNDRILQYNPTFEPLEHGILNREVGDRDMYLDNMNLNRAAIYQSQNIIIAGINSSRYYRTSTFAPTSLNEINGIHSDTQKFVISSFDKGEVEFLAGDSIILRNGFVCLRHAPFRAHIDTMEVCDLPLSELYRIEPYTPPSPNQGNTNSESIYIFPSGLKYWPNPAQDQLTIQAPSPIKSIQLLDANGKEIYLGNINFESRGVNLQIQNLTSGIYFVQIWFDNQIESFKFVKQ